MWFKKKVEEKPMSKITLRRVTAKFNLIDKTFRLCDIEETAICAYSFGILKLTPEEYISRRASNGFWFGKEFIPSQTIFSVEIVNEDTFEIDKPKEFYQY